MDEKFRSMTDGEIVTSYRQAKSRRKQIGILADLNCMTKTEVIKVLRSFGEDIALPRKGAADGESAAPRYFTHRSPARTWTADEVETLRRMAGEGRTVKEVAAALGRGYRGVYAKAYDMRITFADGRSAEASADRKAGGNRSRPVWTSDEVETLRRMAGEGAGAQEIMRVLNRGRTAIYSKANRCGIHIRASRGRPKKTADGPVKEEKKKAAPAKAPPADWKSDLSAALKAAEACVASRGRAPKNVRILAGGEISTVEIFFPGGETYGVILRGGTKDADIQG